MNTGPTTHELAEMAENMASTGSIGRAIETLLDRSRSTPIEEAFSTNTADRFGLRSEWCNKVVTSLHNNDVTSLGTLMQWRMAELEEIGMSKNEVLIIKKIMGKVYGLSMKE